MGRAGGRGVTSYERAARGWVGVGWGSRTSFVLSERPLLICEGPEAGGRDEWALSAPPGPGLIIRGAWRPLKSGPCSPDRHTHPPTPPLLLRCWAAPSRSGSPQMSAAHAPSASSASLGPVVILSSGRVGRKVGVNRSDKPRSTSTPQRWASIQSWTALERGSPATYRLPSHCDCIDTEGLQTAATSAAVAAEELPPCGLRGEPLWELAVATGAPEKWVYGRPQRLLHTSVEGHELWVGRKGALLCSHGHSKGMLRRFKERDSRNSSRAGRRRSGRAGADTCSSRGDTPRSWRA